MLTLLTRCNSIGMRKKEFVRAAEREKCAVTPIETGRTHNWIRLRNGGIWTVDIASW